MIFVVCNGFNYLQKLNSIIMTNKIVKTHSYVFGLKKLKYNTEESEEEYYICSDRPSTFV